MAYRPRILYAHIDNTKQQDHKGLDDLINALDNKAVADLESELKQSKDSGSSYIKVYDICNMTSYSRKEIFKIKDVHQFFDYHETKLDTLKFTFGSSVWQYNEAEGELQQAFENKEFSYLYTVGNAIYMRIARPDGTGGMEYDLSVVKENSLKWRFPSTLQKYVRGAMSKNHYTDFTNWPEHVRYRDTIVEHDAAGNQFKYLNLYQPVTVFATKKHLVPEGFFKKDGTPNYKIVYKHIPKSMSFIKHIFGDNEVEYKGHKAPFWRLGLEYLQLVWTRPRLDLPILVLVSKENKTGKTKFFEWIGLMLGSNFLTTTAAQLEGNFTANVYNKGYLFVDEIQSDKAQFVETLKSLSNAGKQKFEQKNQAATTIYASPNIGFASNNEDNCLPIKEDETRFLVLNPQPIPTEQQDRNILQSLKKELPLFLYLLENLKHRFKSNDRAWFPPKLIVTPSLMRVKQYSKERGLQDLEEFACDYLFTYQLGVQRLSVTVMTELIGNKSTQKDYIRKVCRKKGLIYKESNRFSYYTEEPVKYIDGDGNRTTRQQIVKRYGSATTFTIFATDYMSRPKIYSFITPKAMKVLEKALRAAGRPTMYSSLRYEDLRDSVEKYEVVGGDTACTGESGGNSIGYLFNQYHQNAKKITEEEGELALEHMDNMIQKHTSFDSYCTELTTLIARQQDRSPELAFSEEEGHDVFEDAE